MKTAKETILSKYSILFGLSPSGSPKFSMLELVELLELHAQQFKDEIAILKSELDKAKENKEEVERLWHLELNENKRLRDKLTQREAKIEELRGCNEENSKEIHQLKETIKEYQKQFEKDDKEISSLKEQVEKLKKVG